MGLGPNDILGSDYKLIRSLSRGGMGEVFEAEQISTGSKRAVKLMHPDLLEDAKLRARFELEAKVSSRIPSDHVVQVLVAGVDAPTGTPFLVMELLVGETLRAHVARRGPLPTDEAIRLLRELLHAMVSAHAQGIVHRDLKPENLFLARSRRVDGETTLKVLDFGIAKLLEDAQTHRTAAMGTPLWMAPEQTESGKKVTPATDVWALGLITFYLLTGREYWRSASVKGAGVQATMREMLFDELEPASARAEALGSTSKLPNGFNDVFAKAVARDPLSRYADARDFEIALRPLFGGAPLVPNDDELNSRDDTQRAGNPPERTVIAEPISMEPDRDDEEESEPPARIPPAPRAAPATSSKLPFIVLGVLLAVGLVAFVVSRLDSNEPTRGPSRSQADAESVASEQPPPPRKSIPSKLAVGVNTPILGSGPAPVTIVLFSDHGCEPCQRLLPILDELSQATGDLSLRVAWRDFPLAQHKSWAVVARLAYFSGGHEGFFRASRELGGSSRILELHFTDGPDDLTVPYDHVKERVPDLSLARHAEATRAVDDDIAEATALGVTAPPTMFIDGEPYEGELTTEAISAAVARKRRRALDLIARGYTRDEAYAAEVDANFRKPAPRALPKSTH
ncbi:MAG: protein kinase [Polyangiaceae bacterium]